MKYKVGDVVYLYTTTFHGYRIDPTMPILVLEVGVAGRNYRVLAPCGPLWIDSAWIRGKNREV